MTKLIKDLSFALGQCKCSITDSTVNDLREILSEASKRVEDLVAAQNSYVFTDCMSSLIDVLARKGLPDDVKEQSANVLTTLIKLDPLCRDVLDDELGLSPTLLHCIADRPPSTLQLQVLRLLQQTTYDSKLPWLSSDEGYSLSLIHIIIDGLLENPTGASFETSLGILANFCRNERCRNFVKNIEKFSRLKTHLLSSLNGDNLRVIIYSMTLIFHLSSSGEKVFSTRNIHQTMEVVFNTLINNSSGWTPVYAADLLIDLAKSSRSRSFLENFQYLNSCLRNVFVLICQKPRHVQRKCLELLVAFSEVSSRLRHAISELIFSRDSVQSEEHFSRLLNNAAAARKECPLFALTALVASECSRESVLSASLLRVLYEDFLISGSSLEPRLILLDRMLSATPTACPSATPYRSEQLALLQKWGHLAELATVLLDHEGWFQFVSQASFAQNVEHLLGEQLCSNLICTAVRAPDPSDEASLEGARLALRFLSFMYAIAERHQGSTGFEASLSGHLQDTRVTPLLAFGLLCGEAASTQMALGLIATGLLLENFSITMLGDCLTSFVQSARRVGPKSASASPPAVRSARPLSERENCAPSVHPVTAKLEEAVAQLVENFSAGASLKDTKSSELLALYEHKLQTLQTKESHLEDLLSTKTMSLAQADALIAKYRSRLALSDAENKKLRTLLLEHERAREVSEEALQRQNAALKEMSREKAQVASELKKSSAKLQETSAALTRSSQEGKRLQDSLAEATATLKKVQERAQRLQEESATKAKTIAELDTNIDSYRSRLDEAEHLIREKNKQILKFSEVTKMINSLTIDPQLSEANAGVSLGNSGNSS